MHARASVLTAVRVCARPHACMGKMWTSTLVFPVFALVKQFNNPLNRCHLQEQSTWMRQLLRGWRLCPVLGLNSLAETILEFPEDNLQVTHAANTLCPSLLRLLTPVVFPHASSWVATPRTCLLLDVVGTVVTTPTQRVRLIAALSKTGCTLLHVCLTKFGKELHICVNIHAHNYAERTSGDMQQQGTVQAIVSSEGRNLYDPGFH